MDPSTGKIDISILTTGISGAARKRKAEVTQALKKLIQEKGKVATLKQPKLFEELRERSDLVRVYSSWKNSLQPPTHMCLAVESLCFSSVAHIYQIY